MAWRLDAPDGRLDSSVSSFLSHEVLKSILRRDDLASCIVAFPFFNRPASPAPGPCPSIFLSFLHDRKFFLRRGFRISFQRSFIQHRPREVFLPLFNQRPLCSAQICYSAPPKSPGTVQIFGILAPPEFSPPFEPSLASPLPIVFPLTTL